MVSANNLGKELREPFGVTDRDMTRIIQTLQNADLIAATPWGGNKGRAPDLTPREIGTLCLALAAPGPIAQVAIRTRQICALIHDHDGKEISLIDFLADHLFPAMRDPANDCALEIHRYDKSLWVRVASSTGKIDLKFTPVHPDKMLKYAWGLLGNRSLPAVCHRTTIMPGILHQLAGYAVSDKNDDADTNST